MFHYHHYLSLQIVLLLINSTYTLHCVNVSQNSYCLTGGANIEINGEYVWDGNSANCQVFRHLIANQSYIWLHQQDPSELWFISYNTSDGLFDSIAYCNQLLLDDCIKGKWYLIHESNHSNNKEISIKKCATRLTRMPTWQWWTYTPRPTSRPTPRPTPRPTIYSNRQYTPSPATSTSNDNDSAYVIPIVILFIVVAVLVALFKSTRCNQSADKISKDSDIDSINNCEGDKLMVEAGNSNENIFEGKNVAPSAPEKVVIEGECEGIVNINVLSGHDKYDHIQEWFNSKVDLAEYNEKYFKIFIENGYDKMSLIKEISETHLIKMGITTLAHTNRILNAIQNMDVDEDQTKPCFYE